MSPDPASSDRESERVGGFSRRCRRLALLAVALTALAALCWQAANESGLLLPSANVAPPRRMSIGRYIRSGMWRADARTLIAAGRWLFERDAVPVPSLTNVPSLPAFVTNSAAADRKTV